jgi:hypothetical protein
LARIWQSNSAATAETGLRGPTKARIELIATAIRDYLAQHPEATDSEQGIAKWWVASMGIATNVEEVTLALELLREQGIVDRSVLPDGRAIYRASGPARDVSH